MKAYVLVRLMSAYAQTNDTGKAVDTAKKVLEVNPDSLDALAFLSYVFPFRFNPAPPQWQASQVYNTPDTMIQATVGGEAHVQFLSKTGTSGASAPAFSATGQTVCENAGTAPCWHDGGTLTQYVTTALPRADGDARHGLDVLQKIQKPANMSDEQFKQAVAPKRALFNSTIGFVALQRKDYATSITTLKAAAADNPSDTYNFYRLGLAYLYSNPPDSDHALWYIARAVALARAAKDASGSQSIGDFLKQAYVNYHGTDTGLDDVIAQAGTSVDPPDGFKIAPLEAPKHTGNNVIDAFNDLTFPLKLGGETAQKQWDNVKGQAIGLGGTLHSVEKDTDPNVFLVRIAILDTTKQAGGYDVELKDSTQPNVKNLERGELVTFKGTAESYTVTPTFVLKLTGEVTSELPEKAAAKPKPPVHKPPVHKPTTNN